MNGELHGTQQLSSPDRARIWWATQRYDLWLDLRFVKRSRARSCEASSRRTCWKQHLTLALHEHSPTSAVFALWRRRLDQMAVSGRAGMRA